MFCVRFYVWEVTFVTLYANGLQLPQGNYRLQSVCGLLTCTHNIKVQENLSSFEVEQFIITENTTNVHGYDGESLTRVVANSKASPLKYC